MAIPEPQLGLVISYGYLWHHQHRAGREEGSKQRPCVIVLAIEASPDGAILVQVVPVTHRAADPSVSIKLPHSVKRHLGLDADRSWIILDEINEFVWPGFDLRPIPPTRGRFDHGFLPPRLFNALVAKLREIRRNGRGKAVPRD